MNNDLPEVRQSERGLWRILLPGLGARHLAAVLAPSAPWVVLEDHDLDSALRWIDIDLPVSPSAPPTMHRVRCVRMDLLYSTEQFLTVVDQFEMGGISLWQMVRPPADTLRVSVVAARASVATLREVGVVLNFHLPHAGELALIQTLDRGVLDESLIRLREAHGEAG
jgi:hypothetical protein